jgi:GNAT superfamily N-acetyltransferase
MQSSNSSELHIRKARPDDALAVKAIHKAAVLQLCAAEYTPEQLAAWTRRDDTSDLPPWVMPDSAEIMWVAEQDGTIIGFGSLLGNDVNTVYVHPHYTRQGVGTRLLRKIEQEAKERGVTTLGIEASLTAVPFYQSSGYRFVKEAEHRFSNGVSMRCVIMSKQLRPL